MEAQDVAHERSQIDMEVWWERQQQDAKWGVQRHSWPEWMTVLTEEIGEAAMAANKAYWARGEDAFAARTRLNALRFELIQSAAVAFAIIEHLDEILLDETGT